jgi:hypothetical protein
VALTDELYASFPGGKIWIDNSAGDWEAANQQVLAHLGIPLIPEQPVSQTDASNLVGLYQDRNSDREFEVRFDDSALTIDLFLNVRTRLVRRAERIFLAEGWHFEILFESDDVSGASVLRIGGKDVDYLTLVGTVADKVSV